jgi:hypothetical protein
LPRIPVLEQFEMHCGITMCNHLEFKNHLSLSNKAIETKWNNST